MVQLIRTTLTIYNNFNLGQMVQGESAPSQVHVLKSCIENEGQKAGQRVLKFYLFSLVCTMSGILGAKSLQGSLFMDEANGGNMIWCLQCLQQLGSATPHAVYW